MPEILDEFGKAVLDSGLPSPGFLAGPQQRETGNRFNVYRNNVVLGLTNALAESFPVIRKLVGDANFRSLANVYVRAHPPKTPLMMYYGAGFADFLASFAPLQHLPYLPDTARLEHARCQAFHAPDAVPAGATALTGIADNELANTRLRLHPSMQVLSSPFPVLSIWRYNTTGDRSPLPAHGEDVLIARPFADVEMRLLPTGAAVFLGALQAGATLENAAAKASAAVPDFDLAAQIGGIFQASLLVAAEKG